MNRSNSREDASEHNSLSRGFQHVPAGYGGWRIDSANCRLSRAGRLLSSRTRGNSRAKTAMAAFPPRADMLLTRLGGDPALLEG
jgi:hypothetical protein